LNGVIRDTGVVVLRCESAQLSLDPMRGGAIRDFTWRGLDVLRPTPAEAGDDPLDVACFPMVPYVNRVADGHFDFLGRTVRLERNWFGEPHPLHGHGWRASWDVVSASNTTATLRFEGGGNEWPWRYRSEQCFELGPDELWVELSVENLSDSPMPAMLGLHPYFADATHAQLQAELPRIWLTDAAALPVEEAQTPVRWRFEDSRAIESVALDHCFTGWDGVASLRWPDRVVTIRAAQCNYLHVVTIRAAQCNYLHVYAPAGKDFFCAEPQTAPPGALGRNSGEATVVAPRERFAIRVQFAVGEN
jgi:aldose 1-epimerase